MAYGIVVFGASGSGTTTIGRELARLLNFEHFNTDDYFFIPTEPPFTQERPMQERTELLNAAMKSSFVLSGCIREWGNAFDSMLSLAVFVTTPTDVRLERLNKREFEKYGERIKSGGDLYAYHENFIEYSATYDNGGMETRSLASQEYWANNLTCPVTYIDGTIDWRKNAKTIVESFYTKSDELWRVKTYPLGELKKYRFTVIFARYGNGDCGWLYARHKKRDTWETAGGHIEKGETPLDCAKRELIEETGAEKFSIKPVFDYAVHRSNEFSYGQVFLADIETLGDFPQGSEMREVKRFKTIPDEMTYPQILPIIFDELLKLS